MGTFWKIGIKMNQSCKMYCWWWLVLILDWIFYMIMLHEDYNDFYMSTNIITKYTFSLKSSMSKYMSDSNWWVTIFFQTWCSSSARRLSLSLKGLEAIFFNFVSNSMAFLSSLPTSSSGNQCWNSSQLWEFFLSLWMPRWAYWVHPSWRGSCLLCKLVIAI